MGLIASLLGRRKVEDVYVDLENAKPTEAEADLYGRLQQFLEDGAGVNEQLEAYEGCGSLIRDAMNNATPENEEAAFVALLGTVRLIKTFHGLAERLAVLAPELLSKLGESAEERKVAMEDQQALAKQLAHLFDFVLKFDQLRMMRPSLSNDISYYRRLLPKFGRRPDVEVQDEEASQLTLFAAHHIPMLNAVRTAVTRQMEEKPGAWGQKVTTVLACMANSCLEMMRSNAFEARDVNLLAARAMTGSIVLYDHLNPLGVFVGSSGIHTKKCVQQLKKDFPEELALPNAIRYLTAHFSDDNTPSGIRELLD